jgi:hypothetical protein
MIRYAVIGVVAGFVVMPTVYRNRSKSLVAQGRLECAVRVVGGAVAGLPGRWQHGIAELGRDGHLIFRTYRGGLRPFPRPPVTLRVTAVVDPTLRPLGFPTVMRIAWYCRTVVLATDTGTLQVALLPEIAPWVLNQLVPWTDVPPGPGTGVVPPGPMPPPVPTPTPEGFAPPS